MYAGSMLVQRTAVRGADGNMVVQLSDVSFVRPKMYTLVRSSQKLSRIPAPAPLG
jgi:hypothetical protein